MYQQHKLTTKRLRTAYYRAGTGNEKKLLLLHGNLSSSVFFLPLFSKLEKEYDVVAPDLRCFGDSSALPIDATRGYRDWSDDISEFIDALGWERFTFASWSLGGGVGMQYTMDHGGRLNALVLINPGSPFGFGGTRGRTGKPLNPKGLASGAGLVNPLLLKIISENDVPMLRMCLYNTIFFRPGFRLDPQWEGLFLEALAKTKIGPGMFPGDIEYSYKWPFFRAGTTGVCNAISSRFGDLSGIMDIDVKPPILWIRGRDDKMISERSVSDMGVIGKFGLFPNFPGEEAILHQPMVSQIRYVLEEYERRGGYYKEEIHPGAHCCFVESPDYFVKSLRAFLNQKDH